MAERAQREEERQAGRTSTVSGVKVLTRRCVPDPPCAFPPSSHRWLQSRTVQEGGDPGRRAFYPPHHSAVSKGDALRASAQQQKTLRVAEGVDQPAATPRITRPPPISTAETQTEAVVNGGRLALAAIQLKVRSCRCAASAAATHHVMQERCKCPRREGRLRGERRLRSHLGSQPPPSPPDSPQGRRCVLSARMLEPLQPGGGANAHPAPAPPALAWQTPAVRPPPRLAQHDRALASPAPSPPPPPTEGSVATRPDWLPFGAPCYWPAPAAPA